MNNAENLRTWPVGNDQLPDEAVADEIDSVLDADKQDIVIDV